MQPICYRQGDVFLVPVEKVPAHGTRQARHGVVAEGEVTGHSHRFADPTEVEVFAVGTALFVEVLVAEAPLVHQEHGAIRLPRGCYQVRIQREYTPQSARPVVD